MTKQEATKFLKYLRENYPVNCKVSLKSTRSPIQANTAKGLIKAYGAFSFENGVGLIRVNINQLCDYYTYRTIAHEYRHLMQCMDSGWETIKNGCSQREEDAQRFGSRVAKAYMKD